MSRRTRISPDRKGLWSMVAFTGFLILVKAEKDQQIWTSIYPKVVVHKQKDYLFATQPKADGKGLQTLEVQTL